MVQLVTQFDVFRFSVPPQCRADETVTLSEVLERLGPHLAQIKVLHKVFCTGVAEVPPETPNVVRASHLLNTLYKAIIEYDSIGEASEQGVSRSLSGKTEVYTNLQVNPNILKGAYDKLLNKLLASFHLPLLMIIQTAAYSLLWFSLFLVTVSERCLCPL